MQNKRRFLPTKAERQAMMVAIPKVETRRLGQEIDEVPPPRFVELTSKDLQKIP